MTDTVILKALGALLTYPAADLRAALPEIAAAIEADGLLGKDDKRAVAGLIEELVAAEQLDAEERYVELFDRGRTTSLNLFEHVHGESRERGAAMVDLSQTYERAGYRLAANELPDYLPVLLEFLASRQLVEARDMLVDCAHILRALGEALRDRDSRYRAVFAALLTIAGEDQFNVDGRSAVKAEERSIDEEWLDEQVIFGSGATQSCGATRPQTSILRFVPKVS